MTRPSDERLVTAALEAHDGWITQETLIAEAGLPTQTVTEIVDNLEDAGELGVHDLGRLTLLTLPEQDVDDAVAALFDHAERTGHHALDSEHIDGGGSK